MGINMRKTFRKKWAAIVISALVIAAVTVVSLNLTGGSGIFTNTVGTAVRPLKSIMASVARSLESLYSYMYEHDKILKENEELKVQIAQIEENYREYTETYEENARLKELLGFSSGHSDFVIEQAVILSWSGSNWSSAFTISKGSSNSEITVGDCIINSKGALIGKVSQVGLMTSTVVTVTDTTFSVGVTAGTGKNNGTAVGDFNLMRRGLLKLDFLSDDADVKSGDLVITSGKGGVFPKGLVVGEIINVRTYGTGLGKFAEIRPEEMDDLIYVYLITDFEIME